MEGWWEKGGTLRQRPGGERQHTPAQKSGSEGHTSAPISISSTRFYPRKGQKNRYSPQHIPGTGLSIVIPVSPTVLGKQNLLPIGLQGSGQNHFPAPLSLWSHFSEELDFISGVFLQHFMQYLFPCLSCSNAVSSVARMALSTAPAAPQALGPPLRMEG